MAVIKLLNTSEYAKKRKVSRITIWRMVKDELLDCYILPDSRKKWFAEKEPDIYKTEQKFLDEILTVNTI